MKKTLLLFVTALLFTAGAGHSQSAPNFPFLVSGEPAQPAGTASFYPGSSSTVVLGGRNTDFSHDLKAGSAGFAQLNGNTRSIPLSSMGLLTLVALVVLFGRAFDVRRAKALADNEHHINRSREQMYRSLYKRD